MNWRRSPRARRAVGAFLPVAVVAGLVACSGDDATVSTVTGTAPSGSSERNAPDTTPEITLPGGVTLPGGTLPDLGALPSLPDLGKVLPGGSLPDISIPQLGSLPTNVEEILRSLFPKLGDEQISCLLDKLGGAGGGKIDTGQILAEIQSCGIDPDDLLGS